MQFSSLNWRDKLLIGYVLLVAAGFGIVAMFGSLADGGGPCFVVAFAFFIVLLVTTSIVDLYLKRAAKRMAQGFPIQETRDEDD